MVHILADAAVMITMNGERDVLADAAVCVEADRIVDIGKTAGLLARYPGADVLDCSGKIVMPGMVNTHTHLFQTLLKGLGDDMVLKKWFACMTGPAAVHLTRDDIRGALCTAASNPFCLASRPWSTSSTSIRSPACWTRWSMRSSIRACAGSSAAGS